MLIDKAIAGCTADEVDKLRSLGNTLRSWRAEILAHHHTGARVAVGSVTMSVVRHAPCPVLITRSRDLAG